MTRARAASTIAALAALAIAATGGSARAALTDTAGVPVPNTAAGAQLTSAPSCAGAATGACRRLALAATPGDDPAAALARLWSPRGPQEDLASALDALGTAGTASAAAAARDEAIAILEGRALPGRAYDGIPLLNWDAPRRVRTVPAGGTVDVTEVRFGDHVATDTWLLRFEDPSRPFSIRYHVSELEGTYGGDLAPAPLLADGDSPIGGVQSVDQPLGVHGLRTGTSVASRFTDARGMPAAGAEERTLTGVQEVVVRMPPAKAVTAILESGARTGATASLAPATDDRLAAATTAFGFTGTTPTDAERRTAIGRIAAAAPERQIWDALDALDAADLAAAHAAGTQLAPLVSTMRARGAVPAGVPRDASADVTVVLQNSETYVSRGSMRLAAGGSLRVQVVNRDGFARRIDATSLHTSRRDLGPLAWGTFDWARLATGDDTAIPAGGARIVTLHPRDDAFAVWLGDPAGGAQAGTVLQLDRGPRTESIAVGDVPGAQPVHAALDAQGRLWTTLSGIDEVVRITPSADLSASTRERYLIPGGAHTTTSTAPLLAPGDIAVDHRGIVWMTLAGGNAIGRIDPARTRDGTGDGIRVYPLNACGVHECAVPFPADPRDVVPSREPLQMDVSSDGQGGTAVWFTEAAADKVGVLHVAADGTLLDRADMSCGCGAPAGIALDAAGDVWFTEEITNRIGRLTPGITNPYGSAGIRLRHYDIPSGVETLEPELSRVAIVTSVPHSVALDRNGLIWFTESATGKVGALDPDRAVPGTTQGMTEITVPVNEFGGEAVPADLVVDRANTIIWSDEYGDQIGTVNAGGARADWAPGRSFRPAARRSLTDSPLASPNGDLFFVELGANLLTRVAGATAGLPGPAAPPVIEASPSEGRLSGTGLQETTSVTVTVRRGGDVVARVDAVPVTAGAFRTSVALRAGDVVTLAPRGAQPNPPLKLTVATLTARADATGRITGHALQAGEPLAGKVGLTGAGDATIDPVDGSFSGAAGSAVTWTMGTPAALYRTVEPVIAPARTAPSEPAPPTPAPPVAAPPVAPGPSSPPAGACPGRVWLTRDGRPTILGSTEVQTLACLGRPDTRVRGTWSYGRALKLDVRGGRVVAVRLLTPDWRSAKGGLRVGASRAAALRTLPGATVTARGTLRATLHLASGEPVALRAALTRGRLGSITLTLGRGAAR